MPRSTLDSHIHIQTEGNSGLGALDIGILLLITLQAGRVAADRKPTKLATKLVRGFVGTH